MTVEAMIVPPEVVRTLHLFPSPYNMVTRMSYGWMYQASTFAYYVRGCYVDRCKNLYGPFYGW